MPRDVDVYDHLRPVDRDATDASSAAHDGTAADRDGTAAYDAQPGVYRVVGVDGDGVTLLRVGDSEGYRVNTGELLRIDRSALEDFEPAENPDGNRSPGRRVSGWITDAGWMFRTFLRSLAARPLPSLAAFAVLTAGVVGDEFVDAPDTVFGVAVLVGSLGLAYLGAQGD